MNTYDIWKRNKSICIYYQSGVSFFFRVKTNKRMRARSILRAVVSHNSSLVYQCKHSSNKINEHLINGGWIKLRGEDLV